MQTRVNLTDSRSARNQDHHNNNPTSAASAARAPPPTAKLSLAALADDLARRLSQVDLSASDGIVRKVNMMRDDLLTEEMFDEDCEEQVRK